MMCFQVVAQSRHECSSLAKQTLKLLGSLAPATASNGLEANQSLCATHHILGSHRYGCSIVIIACSCSTFRAPLLRPAWCKELPFANSVYPPPFGRMECAFMILLRHVGASPWLTRKMLSVCRRISFQARLPGASYSTIATMSHARSRNIVSEVEQHWSSRA